MNKSFKIFCGGEFLTSKNKIEILNLFKNDVNYYTYLADNTILENAINKANLVEKELKNLPSFRKTNILSSIANSIQLHKKEFANLISFESYKPLKYSISETERAIQTFRIAAEEAGRNAGEYISIDRTLSGENKEGWIKNFPIGLVGGISPFNFPLNLAVHKIAPAIASGCPIILKPSTTTPLSILYLAQFINETELPKGAVSILPMSRETGNRLVTDERFKLLSFTGSPEVGWNMKRNCGKKKIILELGGNAAAIISKSADLKIAIKKCIVGAFAYSGQVCIHTQRIFVESSIFETFLTQFTEYTKKLKVGSPFEINTDISLMIDEKNAIRVENWVNEAIESGAKLICGGKRESSYIEPTILTNTKNEMKVNSEEIFGPVVVVEPYDDIIDAINKVNNSKFGLQAGIFTNSINEMNIAFNEIDCGGVIINDTPSFRADNAPYGGIKESGLGREGVKYAISEMCEQKILIKNFK